MVFVQINCPNCSAPLEVDSQSKSARCSYCQTTFIPRPETEARNRSAVAAERAAAELTLRRLLREQRETQLQLSGEVYSAQVPHLEAQATRSRELLSFEETRSEKERVQKEDRKAYLQFALLPLGLALISGWTWPWYLVVFLLFFAAHVQLTLNGIRKSKPSEAPPLPPIVRSETEIRLANRLAAIEEEIARHRNFLEESKPMYRKKIGDRNHP
jgi:LSD1 subclass zinc finger protein